MAARTKVNLNDRVALTNLRNWPLHFHGQESMRDITIPPSVKNWRRLTVAEVDAQAKSGNRFFCGTDGFGANAAVQIMDENVRKYVFGIEEADAEQPVMLTLENVKDLIATSPKAAFMEKLNRLVVTDGDKRMIVPLAKKAGIENAESYKVTAIEKISERHFEE